ncbi:uncharacterized protein GGS22DRAFT_175408 [Annulohypoxylon maeteangense]|uniref:uncharacterized protein n=1 Tax=Annulohypoxylon maeteangense TaxID=1927788 RepID=UPI002008986B|nr:uncharacterized protein GGS22DRAFT_175408 [Annulohypoxylon maeteangense]KAI0880349.1 hypothetical protein GGS22DRAFT_175408 [Annulohypoxylon maeteangense]
MIIQVTGRKAHRACRGCKEGKGPFKGCYIIPANAPLHLRRSISGCANCYYSRIQTYCDLKQWSIETYPELSGNNVPKNTGKRQLTESNPPQPNETKRLPARRSLRNILKQERKRNKVIVRSKSNQSPIHQPVRKTQPTNTTGRSDIHSNASTIAINLGQMIELETWEVAPGRIRDEARDTVDNFAFSTAYLAQNKSVTICRDISFQVITIKPGTVHSWDACTSYLRLCSVGSGKLQVKIHGQEFLIGPHGMVMIRPGADCTVTNKLYIDAVVHVTIVPNDLYE